MTELTESSTLYAKLRKAAEESLHHPRLPDRNHESWRKLDLGGLKLDGLLAATESGSAGELNWEANGLEVKSARGSQALELEWVAGLLEAAENGGNLRSTIFARLPWLHPAGLAALDLGPASVLPGKEGAGECWVHIKHGRRGLDYLATRLFLRVRAGMSVTIVEELDDSALALQCPVTDLSLEPGAVVRYAVLSMPHEKTYYFHNHQARLARDSQLQFFYYHGGGLRGKNYYGVQIEGPGAGFRAIGLATGQGRETLDLEIHLNHLASQTSSSIDYRTVLAGHAHSLYNGNLHIASGERSIHSRQSNRNVILSPKARAESMPNLIIKAESVSCEHGATVGQLDPAALFYLLSRGIPEAQARSLLVHGFLDESLEQFPPQVQPAIRASIARRLQEPGLDRVEMQAES